MTKKKKIIIMTHFFSACRTKLYPVEVNITKTVSCDAQESGVIIIINMRVEGRVQIHIVLALQRSQGCQQLFILGPLVKARRPDCIVNYALEKEKKNNKDTERHGNNCIANILYSFKDLLCIKKSISVYNAISTSLSIHLKNVIGSD